MVWARKPLPAKQVEVEPTLIGLDLNATRARAVHGPAQALPRPLPLAGAEAELPMILSLQGRQAEVGQVGVALCRLRPHLTCADFLAHLGESRQWVAGRHRLDALRALALVFEHFQPTLAGAGGIVLTVPAYLARAQVLLLPPLAEKARLPLLGSVRSPLAQALPAYRAEPWSGLALVVDVDDHALTAAAVVADCDQLSAHGGQSWSPLNLRAWKGRILDAVADRCIRQSRRDPRDCAPVEQALFEQVEQALDRCHEDRPAEFLMQGAHWYQHLVLRAEEINASCERLVSQAVHAIQDFLSTITTPEALRVVLVSQAAGRLPGLVSALEKKFPGQLPPAEPGICEDFGEGLLQDRGEPARVAVQPAEAAAQAAHELAGRIQSGELPPGHLDFTIPLHKGDAQRNAADAQKRTFRLLSFDH